MGKYFIQHEPKDTAQPWYVVHETQKGTRIVRFCKTENEAREALIAKPWLKDGK